VRGEASYGRLEPTALGLRWPAAASFERWRDVGRRLGGLACSLPWAIGDWVNAGSQFENHGRRYADALEATGLEYGTLRNYASVARRVELPRRRRELSFHHHEAIAALDVAEQDAWLERAVRERWSVVQLRRRLRESRKGSDSRPEVEVAAVRLAVPAERCERWRAAARARGLELAAWLADVADEAAAAELARLEARPALELVAVA
jgi:hypothetical protein